MRAWLRNFGFPLLILADLAWSAYLTAAVRAPERVPDYALQADVVYRLEVGAACFVVVYLATMAFLLALGGRGFVEFSTKGVRAEQIVPAADDKHQATMAIQMRLIRNIEKDIRGIEDALHEANERLDRQTSRLDERDEEGT